MSSFSEKMNLSLEDIIKKNKSPKQKKTQPVALKEKKKNALIAQKKKTMPKEKKPKALTELSSSVTKKPSSISKRARAAKKRPTKFIDPSQIKISIVNEKAKKPAPMAVRRIENQNQALNANRHSVLSTIQKTISASPTPFPAKKKTTLAQASSSMSVSDRIKIQKMGNAPTIRKL